ncbi:MAG TPA: hypothetical protein VIV12_26900 [Streptosporangiaceae bacterium]
MTLAIIDFVGPSPLEELSRILRHDGAVVSIISVTLEALGEPSFFEECAQLARQEWEQANPGREKRLARIGREVAKKREAIDRYLHAFESGKLSETICGYRLTELEKEGATLEEQR